MAILGTATHSYYHELNTGEFVDWWDRRSSTIGTFDNSSVDGRIWADYVFDQLASNIIEVTATTYAWKILDQWFPAPPSDLKTAFSLHVFNGDCWQPSAVSIEEIELQPSIIVYPNPANDVLYVELAGASVADDLTFDVYDPLGRLAFSQPFQKSPLADSPARTCNGHLPNTDGDCRKAITRTLHQTLKS